MFPKRTRMTNIKITGLSTRNKFIFLKEFNKRIPDGSIFHATKKKTKATNTEGKEETGFTLLAVRI